MSCNKCHGSGLKLAHPNGSKRVICECGAYDSRAAMFRQVMQTVPDDLWDCFEKEYPVERPGNDVRARDGCPTAPVEVRIDLSVMTRKKAATHLREWADYIQKGGSDSCFGGGGMGSLTVRERDVSPEDWENEFMQWWESREGERNGEA